MTEIKKDMELVLELRSRLKNSKSTLDELRLNNDHFLHRYLRTNKMSVEKAQKMLEFYANYNEIHRVDLLLEADIPAEIKKGREFLYGGWDYNNRPLIMIPDMRHFDFREALDKGEEIGKVLLDTFIKLHMTTEKMVLERNVDFGVLIVDLAHFHYKQYFHRKSLQLLVRMIQFIESHSPGVTGKVIMINAPKILKVVVDNFKRIVTFSSEIVIYGHGDKDWKLQLRSHIPQDGIIPHFGGTLTDFVSIQ